MTVNNLAQFQVEFCERIGSPDLNFPVLIIKPFNLKQTLDRLHQSSLHNVDCGLEIPETETQNQITTNLRLLRKPC